MQVFTEVLYDAKIYLDRRPVTSVVATARFPGSSVESPLTIDVIDATKGRLWLVADSSLVIPFYREQRVTGSWGIVTFTYDVTATTAPPSDLVDATAELAAFWWTFDRANVASSGAGPFNETMIVDRPVPAHIVHRLRDHQTQVARLAGVVR